MFAASQFGQMNFRQLLETVTGDAPYDRRDPTEGRRSLLAPVRSGSDRSTPITRVSCSKPSVFECNIARRDVQQVNSEFFKRIQNLLDCGPAAFELLAFLRLPIRPDLRRELRPTSICRRAA